MYHRCTHVSLSDSCFIVFNVSFHVVTKQSQRTSDSNEPNFSFQQRLGHLVPGCRAHSMIKKGSRKLAEKCPFPCVSSRHHPTANGRIQLRTWSWSSCCSFLVNFLRPPTPKSLAPEPKVEDAMAANRMQSPPCLSGQFWALTCFCPWRLHHVMFVIAHQLTSWSIIA